MVEDIPVTGRSRANIPLAATPARPAGQPLEVGLMVAAMRDPDIDIVWYHANHVLPHTD